MFGCFLFLFLCSEPSDLLVDWCELIRAVPLAGREEGLERNNARQGRINSIEVSLVGWNCAELVRLNLTGL